MLWSCVATPYSEADLREREEMPIKEVSPYPMNAGEVVAA